MSLLKVKKITRCNNRIKGLVFKDFISGDWGRGKAEKREKEKHFHEVHALLIRLNRHLLISAQTGEGTGLVKMRFIKTDVLHYCKCKEADSMHSRLCQPGIPKYIGKNEEGRGNVKFHTYLDIKARREH